MGQDEAGGPSLTSHRSQVKEEERCGQREMLLLGSSALPL